MNKLFLKLLLVVSLIGISPVMANNSTEQSVKSDRRLVYVIGAYTLVIAATGTAVVYELHAMRNEVKAAVESDKIKGLVHNCFSISEWLARKFRPKE